MRPIDAFQDLQRKHGYYYDHLKNKKSILNEFCTCNESWVDELKAMGSSRVWKQNHWIWVAVSLYPRKVNIDDLYTFCSSLYSGVTGRYADCDLEKLRRITSTFDRSVAGNSAVSCEPLASDHRLFILECFTGCFRTREALTPRGGTRIFVKDLSFADVNNKTCDFNVDFEVLFDWSLEVLGTRFVAGGFMERLRKPSFDSRFTATMLLINAMRILRIKDLQCSLGIPALNANIKSAFNLLDTSQSEEQVTEASPQTEVGRILVDAVLNRYRRDVGVDLDVELKKNVAFANCDMLKIPTLRRLIMEDKSLFFIVPKKEVQYLISECFPKTMFHFFNGVEYNLMLRLVPTGVNFVEKDMLPYWECLVGCLKSKYLYEVINRLGMAAS
jgi:hypothetical protein